MIKFEHTLFALPFALISAVLAAGRLGRPHSLPAGSTLGWILLAMIGARSAAMAFNRIVDARYDAANPRTVARAIPAGALTVRQVGAFTAGAVALFLYAAYRLNPLCMALSPLALAAVLGYSYTKRFTSLSHLALGFAIGIAPIGAWLAVTGHFAPEPLLLGAAVMLWIGGFDVIYALQDVDFDHRAGLHSLPRAIGMGPALLVSRLVHVAMLGLLAVVGVLAGLHTIYFAGLVAVAALIAYEHALVSPGDLSRLNVAFFTLNGWVSVSLLVFVVLDRWMTPR
ncbi:MAG: UbiA family prenyltransferase [Chthonomonadales bacterium]|nr:UbiA family prenyltransferase [Chthonomonadales bacterium]